MAQRADIELDPELFANIKGRVDLYFTDFSVLFEKSPATVEYAAGRTEYVPPEKFFWGYAKSPSDCTWIVPGT